jgi:hypothetical protein
MPLFYGYKKFEQCNTFASFIMYLASDTVILDPFGPQSWQGCISWHCKLL